MTEKGAGKHPAMEMTEPILRDYMAVERTVMANERTFLSYIRAALGLFIGGASFIEFFDSKTMQVVGWVFLPLGIIAFGLGLVKYWKIKALVDKAENVCYIVTKKE
jgi:putative membrane protein